MSAVLTAVRFAGEGNASRVLKKQLPLITQQFPEVAACHPGTINVRFEWPLIVARPDFRTGPIDWKPGAQEIFDLVRVKLEAPLGKPSRDAWLYVAHRSQHRKDLAAHEIIAPRLELGGVEKLGVAITRQCERLSYRHNPLILVL